MRSAAIGGALTALGLCLAIWAVYQEVRLDWPETALLFGTVFLLMGVGKLIGIFKECICEEEDY